MLVGNWVDGPWIWRPITAGVILSVCAVLNTSAAKRGGVSIPLALCAAGLAASVILMESGNAKLAQLAGALTSCLGIVAALAWWRPEVTLARGAAPVVALVFPGLLLSGYDLTWTEIPAWCFVLAAVSPAALLVDRIPRMSSLKPVQAGAIRVGAVVLPVLVALAGALLAGDG